jgi:alkylation response protein AidB-like acyl-CoA dehydrogenase
VSLKNVYASKNNLVGKEGQGQVLIQKMWPVVMAGRCSEMLGAMQRVLEITLNYVQQRRQFDRPLSAFQVIQHYCADMAIELECSRYIINQAVWRVSNDLPSRKEVAMAKAWSSDAFKKITKIAHQIHGGIGFTKEHDLNLYFRYAKAEELTFGDANFYKEIVAREMDL